MDSRNAIAKNGARTIRTIPTIELPQEFQTSHLGKVEFQIETAHGPIAVTSYGWNFECRGSADALAEHCLIQLDWLPGIDGNNSTSQTVVFDNGPHLVLGHRTRYRDRKAPRITILRISKSRYVVTLPLREAQAEFLADLDEQRRQSRLDQEKAERLEEERARAPKTAVEWKQSHTRFLESIIFRISGHEAFRQAPFFDAFVYDELSKRRIMARIDELRQAILGAGVISTHQPQYKHDGNVIYLQAVTL